LRRRAVEKKSFLCDWRLYAILGFLLTLAATPLSILYFLGFFDAMFAARVTAEGYDQLRVGMTEWEVIKVLGGPTFIDKSAVPRLSGRAARFAAPEKMYPLRYVWQDEEDVIWVDIYKKKVVKFGATLDGDQYGADPDKKKLGLPEKPKEKPREGEDE
jgi:hypothetical protein